MPDIIRPGMPVQILGHNPTGRVKSLFGKGTPNDPVIAIVEIAAQTLTVRVAHLESLEDRDG